MDIYFPTTRRTRMTKRHVKLLGGQKHRGGLTVRYYAALVFHFVTGAVIADSTAVYCVPRVESKGCHLAVEICVYVKYVKRKLNAIAKLWAGFCRETY